MCLLDSNPCAVRAFVCPVVSLTLRRTPVMQELFACFRKGEWKMKRKVTLALLGLVLLFGGATSSRAEVKRVKMHIAGYLCGN